jgi:hypothetical protein
LYARGNFVEAAEVFEHTETRLDRASSEERARYGLYRGATFLRLGEPRAARYWLDYSVAASAEDTNALTSEEHQMLERALLALSYAESKATSVASSVSGESR